MRSRRKLQGYHADRNLEGVLSSALDDAAQRHDVTVVAAYADHHVRIVLAHTVPLSKHFSKRCADFGRSALVVKVGVYPLHQIDRTLEQGCARRERCFAIAAELTEHGHE